MFYSSCSIVKKRSWVCHCNWNVVMCHVPKYCSMIEPHRTMQHIQRRRRRSSWSAFQSSPTRRPIVETPHQPDSPHQPPPARAHARVIFYLQWPNHFWNAGTASDIWFVYTVHQTLPFYCRGGSGLQDYSGTSLPLRQQYLSWVVRCPCFRER